MMNRLFVTLALIGSTTLLSATPLTIVKDIEPQPFTAQVKRLIEATDYVGVPFADKDKKKLESAVAKGDMQSIIVGRHHYIRNGDGREELFDIVADPWETVDLTRTEAGKATLVTVRAALDSARRFRGPTPAGNQTH